MALPPNVDPTELITLTVRAWYEEGEGDKVVSVDTATFESDANGWRVQFVGETPIDGQPSQTPLLFEWLDGEGKAQYGPIAGTPTTDLAEPVPTTADALADTLRRTADPAIAGMVDAIRQRLGDGTDLLGFRDWLDNAWPDIPDDLLTTAFSEAMTTARLAGIYEAQEESPAPAPAFAEPEELAGLIVRALFEQGDLGEVLSVDDVQINTPANGWTILFTGETDGRTAERFKAVFDGETINYNYDNRPSISLSEYPVDFARRRAKKGKRKNCEKGRPCKGTCIDRNKNCPINPTGAGGQGLG
jgi:hypothetical protein